MLYWDTAQLMCSFFDSRAADWDKGGAAQPEMIEEMLSLIPFPTGARVLDLACGTGVMIPFLLRRNPQWLDAIDLSPNMVAVARRKHTAPNLAILNRDFYFHRAEAPYDIAVIYNAYPHFLDKARFAQTLRGMLRPGGRFVIMHGCGRADLNQIHEAKRVDGISVPLRGWQEERAALSSCLTVDIWRDERDRYLLSGTAGG